MVAIQSIAVRASGQQLPWRPDIVLRHTSRHGAGVDSQERVNDATNVALVANPVDALRAASV